MNYHRYDKALQAVIEASIQLSSSQTERISEICAGVLLAKSSQLSWLARRLPQATNKDSRIQWIRRLLKAEYMSQEYVYAPFVKKILERHKPARLHVLMDRTTFSVHDTDLVSFSLNFRKRSIPIGWEFMPHGMSGYELQTSLIKRCYPLLPPGIPVVFHGDNEFGGVRLMQYLQGLEWDFVVGQSSKNYYRSYPNGNWQAFGDLTVTKTKSVRTFASKQNREQEYEGHIVQL